MLKKIILMFLSLCLVTVAGLGVYGFTIYNQSTDVLSKTYKSFGKDTDVIAATKPLTLLLMGVDTGSGSRSDRWAGNSDSMILMTVNPKTKKTTMMSLERDILTNIKNDNETMQAKLNAAYANGGAELAISTVQKMMNIHIDRYVLINMKGLVQLVDAVGGITVNNTLGFPISIEENEPEYKAVVEPGKQHINGDQALVYSRMRYQDPEGDYGRQKRQREVIQKVVQKVLSLNSVSHYQAILKAVSNNMQTNVELSSGSIPQLLGYQDAFKKIESKQLKGEDATLADGGSYQIVTSKHLLKIQNIIRKALGLKEIKTLKTNAYLLDGDEELKNTSSQNDTPAASSEEAPVYQEFNQLPVVPSTQDTGVVTPQSSVAPVTPVAPAATESSSVTPTVPSE